MRLSKYLTSECLIKIVCKMYTNFVFFRLGEYRSQKRELSRALRDKEEDLG